MDGAKAPAAVRAHNAVCPVAGDTHAAEIPEVILYTNIGDNFRIPGVEAPSLADPDARNRRLSGALRVGCRSLRAAAV